MTQRLRTPAMAPPPVVPAPPRDDDPAHALAVHYRRVLAERMAGLPFISTALQVQTIGFQRIDGDWLGAVVTPWSLMLVLVNGGGSLWQDIPAGERRRVGLPVGELEFIADAGEPGLTAWQYCPLIAPVNHIPDMACARYVATEALAALRAPPSRISAEPEPVPRHSPSDSRRNFLRGRFGGE